MRMNNKRPKRIDGIIIPKAGMIIKPKTKAEIIPPIVDRPKIKPALKPAF